MVMVKLPVKPVYYAEPMSAQTYLMTLSVYQRFLDDGLTAEGFDPELLESAQGMICFSVGFRVAVKQHVKDHGLESLDEMARSIDDLCGVSYTRCSYSEHEWFQTLVRRLEK